MHLLASGGKLTPTGINPEELEHGLKSNAIPKSKSILQSRLR
jgi:hypothetical protein